jgi:hypothetical protein
MAVAFRQGALCSKGLKKKNAKKMLFVLLFFFVFCVFQTPGSVGWDITPSIVPTTMVSPSYVTTSSYLVFLKNNDYAGVEG